MLLEPMFPVVLRSSDTTSELSDEGEKYRYDRVTLGVLIRDSSVQRFQIPEHGRYQLRYSRMDMRRPLDRCKRGIGINCIKH